MSRGENKDGAEEQGTHSQRYQKVVAEEESVCDHHERASEKAKISRKCTTNHDKTSADPFDDVTR